MIPRRLIRTVPEHTTIEVEQFWAAACALHPEWDHLTFRDPIDPDKFPLTAPHWDRCKSGAQLAGLIRLEALWHWGGIYLDSDVEPYRPMDTLLGVAVFAGWEDDEVIPDAVIGATAGHPAIRRCLDLALARLVSDSTCWRTGNGSWATGPGVTTTVFGSRADVLLLPPGSFYPAHYKGKRKVNWARLRDENPWAFAAHRWHHSWDGR